MVAENENYKVDSIEETEKIINFLTKRQLLKQYKKAKNYILTGNLKNVDFKIREPKENEIYYFRINKQYRVFGKLENKKLIIVSISDHQD